MSEKIVGILGGMGPDATVDLFQKILRCTPAERDQDHLRILIDCNSKIPDRNEAVLGGGEDPFPYLRESAVGLQQAGAQLIAVPCNAAHCWHAEIQRCVRVPVLHIMDAAADHLAERYPTVRRVGLLAATVTVGRGLYQLALERKGIESVVPTEDCQARVMEVIRAVKAGRWEDDVRRLIREQGEKLVSQGAQAVIAGCTEIPIVLQDGNLSVPVVDATLALALRVVREARG
jgi:aspartate racemase